MTRKIVYAIVLGVFVCATALTITSIVTTHWASYIPSRDPAKPYKLYLGLHESCSSEAIPKCHPFPNDDYCREDKTFCSLWRSSGFLLSFAAIIEFATFVTFIVVMAGGKYKRESGWMLICGLLVLDSVAEFAGTGIVSWIFNHDHQYRVPGWELDYSFYLCIASASVSLLLAAVLAATAYVLPSEDDYEPLEDPFDY